MSLNLKIVLLSALIGAATALAASRESELRKPAAPASPPCSDRVSNPQRKDRAERAPDCTVTPQPAETSKPQKSKP